MWPTWIRSAGTSAPAPALFAESVKPVKPCLSSDLLVGDQASHGRRQLCANALPVSQTLSGDAQALCGARRHRVVEADALDEAAVATVARIGCDDVVERALLGTTTS